MTIQELLSFEQISEKEGEGKMASGLHAGIGGLEDELNGENILPGFKLLVSKLFNFPLKAQEKPVKGLNFDK